MDGEKRHRESPDELLAANLRTMREDLGLSQAALAAAMRKRGHSWHQSTVARVEAGQQPVRFAEAVELAAVLKTSLDRLTWTTQEASAGLLMDMTIGRLHAAWEKIAAGTVTLLYNLSQLETTVGEAERAGCYDSDRIREIVREAHMVLTMTPEGAMEQGHKDYERMRQDGEEPEEEYEDDDARLETQPRIHGQRDA